MKPDGAYRRSSIGRAIDPSYPTNRAVLIILPIVGLLGLGLAYWREVQGWGLVLAAIGAAGTAFGGWALARELAPDDEFGAFISMALALVASFASGHTSVMLLITTLMLARIVNRSVGLPAKVTDSVALVILTTITVYSTGSALPAVVAALAFALDASMSPRLPRQWIFAGWSIGVAWFYWFTHRVPRHGLVQDEPTWMLGLALAITLGYIGLIVTTRQLVSRGDATAIPLSPSRVRAGMVVGLAMAVGGLIFYSAVAVAPIWGVLLGVTMGKVVTLKKTST